MNIADAEIRPIDLEAGGEDTLVARPHAEVQVRALPAGGAVFLAALVDGQTLARAADRALHSFPAFNLTDHLTEMLETGLVIAWRLKQRRSRGT